MKVRGVHIVFHTTKSLSKLNSKRFANNLDIRDTITANATTCQRQCCKIDTVNKSRNFITIHRLHF